MRRYGEEGADPYELLDSARQELDDAYTQLRSEQGGPLGVGERRRRKRSVNWWNVAAAAVAAVVVGFLAGVTVGSANPPPSESRPQVPPGPTAPAGDPTGVKDSPTPADGPADPSPDPSPGPDGPAPGPGGPAVETSGAFSRSDGEEGGGTLGDPLPVGVPVSDGEWEVVLGEPREAWAEIRAENSLNDPPPPGMEFWVVPVTATYLGEGPGRLADLTIHFEGSDKETYAGMCGVVPDSVDRVGELYEGGTGEGLDCVEVPAGGEGLWTLRSGWDAEPVYFHAGS